MRGVSCGVKQRVLEAYSVKDMTVGMIAEKYGIAKRTIYKWVSDSSGTASRGRRNSIRRKALYLSKEEAETILLMIMVSENDIGEHKKLVANNLEERLLNIADELTEV